MRVRSVLLASAAALVALAVACAWTLPPLLDWSRFRGSAEALASFRLGRPVTIAGPISLSLLPRPVLTAEQLSMGEVAQGGGSFSVQSVRMQVALAPLLSGRIDARELVLRRPVLRLPWPVPPSLLAARPAGLSDGFTARVEDGSVTLGDLAVGGINASLGTDAAGGISAAGMMVIAEQPWRFAVRLGGQDRKGAAAFELALDGGQALAGTGMKLSGQLAGDGTFDGRVTARGLDLSRVVPAPALPFQAEGRLTAAGGYAVAKDLSLELGGSPARATVRLGVSPAARLDVALSANRIDLDAWGPALVQGRKSGMPISLDLSAEAATLSGGLLRNVRAALNLQSERVGVSKASATLPGDATLGISGVIPSPADFDGDATLAAPDLRTTLQWLQASPARLPWDLPSAAFHSAALSARIAGGRDGVAVENLTGSLDGTAVGGSIAIRTGPAADVKADLRFDRLDLDPYLPTHRPTLEAIFERLRSANADVTLHAASVVAGGRNASDAALAATLKDGQLDLKTLSGTLDGVHARLSGAVDSGARLFDLALQAASDDARPIGDWVGQPGLDVWQGPLTLRASAKGGPEALGLRIGADLGDARLEAEPTLDLAASRWHGALTFRHPGARRFVRATGIGRALGMDGSGDWLGDGSLSLVAQMSGEPGRLSAERFELTAGELHAGGALTLTSAEHAPRLVGKVTAETLPLPALGAHSDDPLPAQMLRGWQASLQVSADTVLAGLAPVADHASAELSLAGGVLHIQRLHAVVRGGEVNGEGTIDGASTPPSLTMHAGWSDLPLKGNELPLVTSGRAGGTADLTATGYRPATLLATLRGSVGVHVADGTLAGVDLPALRASLSGLDERADAAEMEAEVRQAIGQGTTPFSSLDAAGRLGEGDAGVSDLRIAAPAGHIKGSGDMSLAEGTIDLRLLLQPDLPDGPEIGVRVSGPAAAPANHPDLTGLAAWLGERASAPMLSPR